MGQEILVALKSEDRLSHMIPYIEKVAQPGMKVVFLIRFISHSASNPSRHDSIEPECPEQSVYGEGESEQPRFAAKNISGTQSMEAQKLSAEHKVFLALEALIKRGIEITVDVYMGSLRRIVKSYTRKGDVHLIVMRASKKRRMMEFVQKAFTMFGVFRRPTFSPVLVLHPTQAV